MSAITAREAAFRSLLRIENESRYSNLETDLTLKKSSLGEIDARFYVRLVYGTVERKLTLDYLLARLMTQDFGSLDPEVKIILRLSSYQILYMDRVPDSAAVNEGVELCKRHKKSASPFVNAVLRRLTREKETQAFPDPVKEPVSYLSVFYSVSEDVCKLFYGQFGFEESCRLLEKMNENPPLTLRVNTLKTTREDYRALLDRSGVPCENTEYAPHGLRVRASYAQLPGEEEGLFFVQDEASQLAVEALGARPGMRVLDLCACPGGKSFGAAMDMRAEGEILAFDLHKNKLSLIEEGAKRLGISIVRTAAADARVFLPELEKTADRMILDLPCSGLGVIAKKPDLRYKREEDMERLTEIQRAILDNACRYLKPGGRMIFSTCTVLKRENEELLFSFLRDHPDFAEDELRLPLKECGSSHVTLLPHIHCTDGFFISALRRKEE